MLVGRLKDKRNKLIYICNKYIVQFSRSVMSDSLRPHESQHARPPCPSPTPGSPPKPMSIVSVMPSNHLILCRPLLLLLSAPTLLLGFLLPWTWSSFYRLLSCSSAAARTCTASSHYNYYLFLFFTGVMHYNYRFSCHIMLSLLRWSQ